MYMYCSYCLILCTCINIQTYKNFMYIYSYMYLSHLDQRDPNLHKYIIILYMYMYNV